MLQHHALLRLLEPVDDLLLRFCHECSACAVVSVRCCRCVRVYEEIVFVRAEVCGRACTCVGGWVRWGGRGWSYKVPTKSLQG